MPTAFSFVVFSPNIFHVYFTDTGVISISNDTEDKDGKYIIAVLDLKSALFT